MRNLLPVLFLITIALAPGCKKPESPIVYVQKEMLEYCWFPDGSYWIYEEENTPGWMDSVYSANRGRDIIPDSYGEGFQAESYGWSLIGTQNSFGQVIIAWGIPPTFTNSYSEMTEYYRNLDPSPFDQVFFWDSRVRDTLSSYPDTFVKERYDSVMISGKTYYDAIEVVTAPPGNARHTFQVIWARGVGIVKRSMTNGQVWNLVRHRIR